MKESTEQRLDELTKKMMSSTKLESPSSNFTQNLMAKIEQMELEPKVHKPLISKVAWIFIGVVITGIILYSSFFGLESFGLVDNVDYSIIENNKVTEALSGLSISKTLMYSILLFGVFMLVQMTVLKNYFDKRLQL